MSSVHRIEYRGLIMEPVANDVEETIQKLCAEADGERNLMKVMDIRARLAVYLHEHASVLTSMSEETYQALRKIKPVRRRRSPQFGTNAHL
jgi:hypothetical protein